MSSSAHATDQTSAAIVGAPLSAAARPSESQAESASCSPAAAACANGSPDEAHRAPATGAGQANDARNKIQAEASASAAAAAAAAAAAVAAAAGSRKHVELSLELKRKLIAEHEHGVPFTLLGKKYHIATSTAANIWRKKDFFLRSRMSGSRKRCNDRSKYKIVNQVTALFVKSMLERNHKIDGEVIKRFARTAAAQCNFKDFHGSNGWLDSFKKRENVCWVRRRGGSTAAGNSSSSVAPPIGSGDQVQMAHHLAEPSLLPITTTTTSSTSCLLVRQSDSPNLSAAASAAAAVAADQHRAEHSRYQQQQHQRQQPRRCWPNETASAQTSSDTTSTCARCSVAAAAAAVAALNSGDSIHERDNEIEDWFHGIPFLCQFFEDYQSMQREASVVAAAAAATSGSSSGSNSSASSLAAAAAVAAAAAAATSASERSGAPPMAPVRSMSDGGMLVEVPMDTSSVVSGCLHGDATTFRTSVSAADIESLCPRSALLAGFSDEVQLESQQASESMQLGDSTDESVGRQNPFDEQVVSFANCSGKLMHYDTSNLVQQPSPSPSSMAAAALAALEQEQSDQMMIVSQMSEQHSSSVDNRCNDENRHQQPQAQQQQQQQQQRADADPSMQLRAQQMLDCNDGSAEQQQIVVIKTEPQQVDLSACCAMSDCTHCNNSAAIALAAATANGAIECDHHSATTNTSAPITTGSDYNSDDQDYYVSGIELDAGMGQENNTAPANGNNSGETNNINGDNNATNNEDDPATNLTNILRNQYAAIGSDAQSDDLSSVLHYDEISDHNDCCSDHYEPNCDIGCVAEPLGQVNGSAHVGSSGPTNSSNSAPGSGGGAGVGVGSHMGESGANDLHHHHHHHHHHEHHHHHHHHHHHQCRIEQVHLAQEHAPDGCVYQNEPIEFTCSIGAHLNNLASACGSSGNSNNNSGGENTRCSGHNQNSSDTSGADGAANSNQNQNNPPDNPNAALTLTNDDGTNTNNCYLDEYEYDTNISNLQRCHYESMSDADEQCQLAAPTPDAPAGSTGAVRPDCSNTDGGDNNADLVRQSRTTSAGPLSQGGSPVLKGSDVTSQEAAGDDAFASFEQQLAEPGGGAPVSTNQQITFIEQEHM